MGFVTFVLFNQSLDRQVCIDDDGPVHAQPAVSASLISRASWIKSAELPGRGLSPNISCRSSAHSSWSGLSDNSPAFPLASSLVNSRSMAAWQYPRMLMPLNAAMAFSASEKWAPGPQGKSLLGFHRLRPYCKVKIGSYIRNYKPSPTRQCGTLHPHPS